MAQLFRFHFFSSRRFFFSAVFFSQIAIFFFLHSPASRCIKHIGWGLFCCEAPFDWIRNEKKRATWTLLLFWCKKNCNMIEWNINLCFAMKNFAKRNLFNGFLEKIRVGKSIKMLFSHLGAFSTQLSRARFISLLVFHLERNDLVLIYKTLHKSGSRSIMFQFMDA